MSTIMIATTVGAGPFHPAIRDTVGRLFVDTSSTHDDEQEAQSRAQVLVDRIEYRVMRLLHETGFEPR